MSVYDREIKMLKLFLFISFGALCLASKGCPRLGSLREGNVTCTRFNYHGSRCSFVCKAGYDLYGGSGSVSCKNGRWFRGRSNKVANLVVHCVEESLGRSASGNDERCSSAPCAEGYPGISAEACERITGCCWNEANSLCKKVTLRRCGYQGIPATLCALKGCNYDPEVGECHRGTSLEQLPGVSARSGPRRSFSERNCHPRIKLRNSRIDCASRDDTSFRCEISCDVGYYLVGESFYICNNGNYANFTFDWECREILCPALEDAYLQSRHNATGALVKCSEGWRAGTTCTLRCPEHHRSLGSSSLKCMSDGRWNVGTFICQENPKCQDLRQKWPGLGWGERLLMNCSNAFYHGGKCEFKCAKGFRLQGSKSSRCVDKPQLRWNNKPPRCLRMARQRNDCDFVADLRAGRIVPNPHVRVVQRLAKRANSNRRSCDYKGSIQIDFSRMKNLTLKLTYSNPRGSHIQIGTDSSPAMLKGYYRIGLRNNKSPLPIKFTHNSEVMVTFHKIGNIVTFKKGRTGPHVINLPAWSVEPKITVHFNSWKGITAPHSSGLCRVCVSYQRDH